MKFKSVQLIGGHTKLNRVGRGWRTAVDDTLKRLIRWKFEPARVEV